MASLMLYPHFGWIRSGGTCEVAGEGRVVVLLSAEALARESDLSWRRACSLSRLLRRWYKRSDRGCVRHGLDVRVSWCVTLMLVRLWLSGRPC